MRTVRALSIDTSIGLLAWLAAMPASSAPADSPLAWLGVAGGSGIALGGVLAFRRLRRTDER